MKVKKTEYKIVKTSTGRFRIATETTFFDGYKLTGFLGGPRSKRYCFSTLEYAEKIVAEWQAMNARIAAAE